MNMQVEPLYIILDDITMSSKYKPNAIRPLEKKMLTNVALFLFSRISRKHLKNNHM